MSNRNTSCEERINEELEGRMENLRILWDLYCEGDEEGHPELGTFYEYGLGFDYICPYTWEDQPDGYYRYQLSWGSPSDEFRFYEGGRIEYWFMDWFDGACRIPRGTDLALIGEIRDWLLDTVPSFDEAEKAAYEAGDFQYPNEDEDYLDELEDEDDD